jgi:hypothetical protein
VRITLCYKWVMSDGDDKKSRQGGRKERVLHTRVPAVLEQELKRVANAWRVPVSNVVRALLEDALDTLEHLSAAPDALESTDSLELAEGAGGPEAPVAPLEGAVGVTPITLVHDAVCGVTGRTLPAGSEAYMVLFDDPGRKLITGRDALPHASTPNQEKADD